MNVWIERKCDGSAKRKREEERARDEERKVP
jgi:hypothetical protein